MDGVGGGRHQYRSKAANTNWTAGRVHIRIRLSDPKLDSNQKAIVFQFAFLLKSYVITCKW